MFVTLTFAGQRNWKYVKKTLREWRLEIIDEEDIQIAFIGVASTSSSQTHIHVLMLGYNRFGKTLSDVDTSKWVKRWKHGKADIEPIVSNIGADFYIQKHMDQFKPDAWTLLDFNLNLLDKLKNKPVIISLEKSYIGIIDNLDKLNSTKPLHGADTMIHPHFFQFMLGSAIAEMRSDLYDQDAERYAEDLEQYSAAVRDKYENLRSHLDHLELYASTVEHERDQIRTEMQTLLAHGEAVISQVQKCIKEFITVKTELDKSAAEVGTKAKGYKLMRKLLASLFADPNRWLTTEITDEDREKIMKFLSKLPE